MSSSDLIPINGKIVKVLRAGHFNVKPENDEQPEILAYISGRMKENKITLVLGDAVIVEVSPYDLTNGRITRRLEKRK